MSARLERDVEVLRGAASAPYLAELAALRCEVFREYPYLYEGSPEYEQRYLRVYARSPDAVVVLACDAERVVGAATALPLLAHGEELAPALARAGYDPAHVYYFGESVLRASYRGRGIGHRFFDEREAVARELGFRTLAFCAVERGEHHRARPRDYVPHDAFWTKRGFERRPAIVAQFAWRDLGDSEETKKDMVFWLKELRS